jgi:hypothetical protein
MLHDVVVALDVRCVEEIPLIVSTHRHLLHKLGELLEGTPLLLEENQQCQSLLVDGQATSDYHRELLSDALRKKHGDLRIVAQEGVGPWMTLARALIALAPDVAMAVSVDYATRPVRVEAFTRHTILHLLGCADRTRDAATQEPGRRATREH